MSKFSSNNNSAISRIATVQKLHYGIEIPFAKGTPTHEQNGVTTVNMFANKNVRSARILDNMNGRLGSRTEDTFRFRIVQITCCNVFQEQQTTRVYTNGKICGCA